ncbi:hypothetical protein N7E02_21405 [Aliirhizobium terrae]|uniref:hypothetical protein n=1 Tax=Terrirhizobium terrae TaxID=2926709 RepID=UPI002577F1DA|nr:hypothetical protein [Rhizobium sp. CC-CFT758]WJH39376.1 hypothetical protein N7E02_21405 [Rhizobium sp. CC-CFT758]
MTTPELRSIDDAMDCCGRYTLRNTQHQSIAGLTPDGSSIFAVHSNFAGKNFVSVGGFDRFGTPIVPTADQQKILFNFVPKAEKIIILDAKSKTGPLGVKLNGTNPRVAAYASNKEMIFEFGFTIADDKWSIDTDTSVELDWKGNLKKEVYGVKGRYDAFSAGGRMERAGGATTQIFEAAYNDGRYDVGAKRSQSGANSNLEVNAGMKVGRNARLGVYWKPNVRPPTQAPLPKTFSKDEVVPFEDYSNFGITFKIEI